MYPEYKYIDLTKGDGYCYLDSYFFTTPYREGINYPHKINMKYTTSYISENFINEINKFKKINIIDEWSVTILTLIKDYKRNCYVCYNPVVNNVIINSLKYFCRCNICKSRNMKWHSYHTCLCLKKYGKINLTSIFNHDILINETLQYRYNIVCDEENYIFCGSNIIENDDAKQLSSVEYNLPRIIINEHTQKSIMDECWFYEEKSMDDVNMHIDENRSNDEDETIKNRSIYVKMSRPEYPFIEEYLMKFYIFKTVGSPDKIYGMYYGVGPKPQDLEYFNDRIKDYCQCFDCTTSYLNPLRYIFGGGSLCLKKNVFWCDSIHKNTLLKYASSLNINKRHWCAT